MKLDNLFTTEEINELQSAVEKIKPTVAIPTNSIQYQCYTGLDFFIRNINQYSRFAEYEILQSPLIEVIEKIINRSNIENNELFELYLCLFKYFYYSEIIILRLSDKSDISINFINLIKNNPDIFNNEQKKKITEITLYAPIHVARGFLHSTNAEIFKEFTESYKDNKAFHSEWNIEHEKKLEKIEELKKNIENIKSEYNFVGLVDGFKNIRSKKQEESQNTYCGIMVCGLFMIMTPIVIALLASIPSKIAANDYISAFSWLIPGLTIELLILYFFRILLQQFKSIQAQLLQIDLRISLCQFIESYITYKSTNIKEGDEALVKFESLIFSGIVADAGSIPSTFEGIEQIASIFKSIGSNKN